MVFITAFPEGPDPATGQYAAPASSLRSWGEKTDSRHKRLYKEARDWDRFVATGWKISYYQDGYIARKDTRRSWVW